MKSQKEKVINISKFKDSLCVCKCLVCLAVLFINDVALAQTTDGTSVVLNKKRIKLVLIASGTAYIGAITTLNNVWYSHATRSSFHFFDDSHEWKQMDKVGHFYSSFQLASIGSRILQWSSLPINKSDRIAALSAFGMMASIEILDGFSSAYGASISDLSANTIGIAFYMGQKAMWHQIRLYPKMSFHRTSFAPLRPETLGNGIGQELIKDYNGQTQWLSIDMDKFIVFPKWLNIALGYGIDGMIYANDQENRMNGFTPRRQFYLALDVDFTAWHFKSKILNTMIYFLNMIKIPAPTLELTNGKLHGHALYF